MKNTDRRILRTRQSLMDALIDVVLENGYSGLTVRDITQQANISYSTFFRHFKSIDALVEYVLIIGRDRIFEMLTDGMSAQDEALTAYSFIKQNPRLYTLFANLPRNHPGIEVIRNEMAESVREFFVARNESVVPLEIVAHHHATATLELLRWWINNDMNYSPQEMATIHFELIVKSADLVAKDLLEVNSLDSARV